MHICITFSKGILYRAVSLLTYRIEMFLRCQPILVYQVKNLDFEELRLPLLLSFRRYRKSGEVKNKMATKTKG